MGEVMKIRNLAAGVTLAGAVFAPMAAIPAAHAATSAVWVTTYTNHYSRTATAQTWYQETREASGSDYYEWRNTERRDNSGAGYNATLYRAEGNYPHYRQAVSKTAWSKAGKVTLTYVVTSG